MQDRITLQAFAEVLQPYRESVQAADALLGDLSTLHQERSVLTVQQRMDLLRALAALAQVYEGFFARVEASTQLPLAVISGRLPLLKALIDAKRQVLALAEHFAALELPPTRLDVSHWWETERALSDMQHRNEAVGEEARRLLERARFEDKKLLDQGAIRRPPASTQRHRNRE